MNYTLLPSTGKHEFSTRVQEVQRAEQMKGHPAEAGLVIGNRDREVNAVSVRVRGKGNLGAKPRAEVIAEILQSINERRA